MVIRLRADEVTGRGAGDWPSRRRNSAQFMPLQQTEIPRVRENTTVISKDGTPIAVSKLGDGRPLVLIDGAFCYRGNGPFSTLQQMAARIATRSLLCRSQDRASAHRILSS
jgi:hypothetical protein